MKWDAARRQDRVTMNPYAGDDLAASAGYWIMLSQLQPLLDALTRGGHGDVEHRLRSVCARELDSGLLASGLVLRALDRLPDESLRAVLATAH